MAAGRFRHLYNPSGVTLDARRQPVIGDSYNARIRQVTKMASSPPWLATASVPMPGRGPATNASLYYPTDVAVTQPAPLHRRHDNERIAK